MGLRWDTCGRTRFGDPTVLQVKPPAAVDCDQQNLEHPLDCLQLSFPWSAFKPVRSIALWPNYQQDSMCRSSNRPQRLYAAFKAGLTMQIRGAVAVVVRHANLRADVQMSSSSGGGGGTAHDGVLSLGPVRTSNRAHSGYACACKERKKNKRNVVEGACVGTTHTCS